MLLDLVKLATRILPSGWDIEVVEVHHNQKIDAPSGTAKRIITGNTDRTITESDLSISDIPAHALRVGDTFGEHTVWMCGPGERLEIKHVATNVRFCHWSTSLGRVASQPTQRACTDHNRDRSMASKKYLIRKPRCG